MLAWARGVPRRGIYYDTRGSSSNSAARHFGESAGLNRRPPEVIWLVYRNRLSEIKVVP
jgi:hypothetical protein